MCDRAVELVLYPNCSMGGMATVYRNRIKDNPNTFYNLLFVNDLGGRSYFDDLPNAQLTIVRKDRLQNYLRYLLQTELFDKILVTSMPEAMNVIASVSETELVYEFHTSTEQIIAAEIERLEFDSLSSIQVPSYYLRDVVEDLLAPEHHNLLKVQPNLVDGELFQPSDVTALEIDFENKTPLIWLGRLDAGKNVNDFLRVLSQVDDKFCGVIVLGLESDPSRFANFLGYASSLGVRERIKILVNLPQEGVADLYNAARKLGGFFVSTSLGESFGYGVQEALSSGLDTIAYHVGALGERKPLSESTKYILVDVGDITAMSRMISAS